MSIIAIDAGGTSTRALVVDTSGTCLTESRGGPGNPRSSARAAATIAQVAMDAITTADTDPQVAVVTMAGLASLGGHFPDAESELRRAGFRGRVTLVSDLHGMYYSATDESVGSVLIAGTGATAASFRDGELTALRDGLGWLLGDSGAGFWIGTQVARAVAAELDHRGPATSLTGRVIALLPAGITAPPREDALAALLAWTYARRPVDLADLAILASEESGHDDVAARICHQAFEHLRSTLDTLPDSAAGPVVIGGSVLGANSPIGHAMIGHLGPRARRTHDGIVGAAVLALRSIGIDADLRSRILGTRGAAASSSSPCR